MRGILILLVVLVFQSCYKEDVVFDASPDSDFELPTLLRLNKKECFYDHSSKSLRYPIQQDSIPDFTALVEFQEYSEVTFSGLALENKSQNNLGTIKTNTEYSLSIKSNGKTNEFSLFFTNLPTVRIVTPNAIYDEPKSYAKVTINDKNTLINPESYYIGLEQRGGGLSRAFPKKSIGFAIKSDKGLYNDLSRSLLGMKANNDWILDAMWIDPSKIRNTTSFELWKRMDEDHTGIIGQLVELYINNEHQGLYSLNQNVNAEFLNIENSDAVLYKATSWEDGATQFETYMDNIPSNYYWDGWEQKYPDPKQELNWNPLANLRSLVVNSSDATFDSEISSMIDIDNLVDYYIFMNLASATDNSGKNTFLVKESTDDPFQIIPWDLDGSWGLFWDGTHITDTSVHTNALFDRLLFSNTGTFKSKLKVRWTELRSDLFTELKLKQLFNKNFKAINRSSAIQIENEKWGKSIDLKSEQEHIYNAIEHRLFFLDHLFYKL